MPYAHISQPEARAHLKRLQELERIQLALKSRWSKDYPGTHLGSFTWAAAAEKVKTARACDKVVVVVAENDVVKFYAAQV